MKTHYQILIVGAGTGGIMTASTMLNRDPKLDIGIIDPAEYHYYQPAWTLVGAGTYDFKKTRKQIKDLIPSAAHWVQDEVTMLDPGNNRVETKQHGFITYDYLVLSPGLVMVPSMIEGLEESLDKGVVCSVYTNPEHMWDVLRNFKGGNALFTQPATPIKCGGAPQKIAYLSADYIRKHGLANKSEVIFATPGSVIFGVTEVAETLTNVIERYGMHFKPFYSPVKIDGENKVATFKYVGEDLPELDSDNSIHETLNAEGNIEIPFELFHMAPPQAAPKFIRESSLANEAGWLDVNIHTLQSNKFSNVFGIGDCADLPTAKTGAAIRKQMPVVIDNIFHLMKSKEIGHKSYNGYSSCPLVTAYGKMVLAEFDYDQNFTPDPKLKQMLVFDSSKEHWRLWMLKKYGLPYLYWQKMMKGKEV